VALLERGLSPEPPEPPPPRLGLAHILAVLLTWASLNAVGAALLRQIEVPFLPPSWTFGLALLLGEGLTCLAVILVLLVAGEGGESLGLKPPRRPRNVPSVILIYASFIIPLTVVGLAWQWLLGHFGLKLTEQRPVELYRQAGASHDWVGMAIVGLGAVVAAPLAEELLFRGLIFGILKQQLGKPAAVLLASAAFAAFHVQPEVVLPIFFVGLVLNLIYLRTGCLAYSILFHAVFNGSTLFFIS
jgi:membrane protease YdiL (CAAX protease family)